ncbi:MAG: ATP synthase subunit a [Parcubacteria group bacterium GW2011_GWC2_39_14]|nr:MAG: ATP synthase subunit a [Parcubacteria group bacterium GW2011_GWC2_39_14]KKR55351.1 MAG: ATP synthase subunit a [Parcubacteria group bacterium GW2011_GWA2_40_23]
MAQSGHATTEVQEIETAQTEEAVTLGHNSTDAKTEVSHEATLAAEPIAHFGAFPITNSLLNTWIVVAILFVFAIVLRSKLKIIPKGLQNLFEIVVDGALNLCDSVTNDRKKTLKVFPIVFSFFIFILIANWMGLVPGIGSIGFIETEGAHSIFVPYFRGGTADLNTTLALALIAVIGSNIFGIIAVGGWKYFNKFVNLKILARIPFTIKKDPSVIIVNPIKFFVGIIEIIGEVAKIASLSFRLFGNVFAGEVLLSSLAVILAFGLPIPFMFLEVIVGVIQALIFGMLTLVYFSIAMTEEEH